MSGIEVLALGSPVVLPLALTLGYVLGAIPFGVLTGKALKGVDVRQFGSGKTGSANVTRSLGVRIGLLVMALDMGKGVAAVIVGTIISGGPMGGVLAGIAAVAGHNWSAFIGFTGGRGVSVGVGGLLALAPGAGITAAIAAFSVMGLSRYVSVGSMAGAVVGGVAAIVLVAAGRASWVLVIYAATVAPLIIYQHRDNIGRLRRGEERRIGQKADLRRSPDQATGAG